MVVVVVVVVVDFVVKALIKMECRYVTVPLFPPFLSLFSLTLSFSVKERKERRLKKSLTGSPVVDRKNVQKPRLGDLASLSPGLRGGDPWEHFILPTAWPPPPGSPPPSFFHRHTLVRFLAYNYPMKIPRRPALVGTFEFVVRAACKEREDFFCGVLGGSIRGIGHAVGLHRSVNFR